MIYSLVAIVVFLIILTMIVLRLPVFGVLPEGPRLARIQKMSNYKDGSLQNLSPTPVKPAEVSWMDMIKRMIKGNKNGSPKKVLPHVAPDFSKTADAKLIWFGHSSYLLQVDGLNILVDPVFGSRTSPFSFIGSKNFPGTDFVKAEDFPELDIVLLTHDHYDHLDYPTILKIKDKTKRFVTSLGVGGHLEKWGVDANKITELSWSEETEVNGLKFRSTPARHFTGRSFKRNQTLWSSFILQTATHKLFLGGDSGYDTHFKNIGEEYGPFDLAILECGQYNDYWPLIHMFPEQTVQAALDLKAKVLLPVHWGKFALSIHDWDDSIIRVAKKAAAENLQITTPMLGQSLIIGQEYPNRAWYLEGLN